MKELVKFDHNHAHELDIDKDFNLAFKVPHIFELYEKFKNAKTLYVNGKPIICGGVVDLWAGVGEAWMLVSETAKQLRYTSIVGIKEFVDDVFKDYHRLQAIVDCENYEGIRLVEWLGFDREGMLRKYSMNGRDQFIYARVK